MEIRPTRWTALKIEQLREDLAALGVRLAVVEHRTDALESRFAATEQHSTELCEAVDCPGS